MGRKSRLFAHSISSLDFLFAELEAEIAESLRPVREYSHFAETIGGDWFDHDCRPTRAAHLPHQGLRKAVIAHEGPVRQLWDVA
jgi:hypothetical protein